MATTQDYLNLIAQYESGNRNIPNYKYGPGYSAQGYYQITNDNWSKIAPLLGIDTSVYPSAMFAPQNVQAQVAAYLLTETPAGVSNWSNYNSLLFSALAASGMQTSGQVSDSVPVSIPISGGTATPLFDISGAAAATPTGDILAQIDTSAANVFGMDTSTGGLILLGIAAAGAIWLAGR